MNPTFVSELQSLLTPNQILTEETDRKAYGADWTRVPGEAGIVVFPKSTEEISKILKLCQKHRVPVIPSGGRTGLAGGITAKPNEVALNLSKMNRMDPVDVVGRTVRVQAGAVTEAVHEHCAEQGLVWPIDLASKGTCQIGGNLATNAGGVRVIRYGMARKWVVALQAVTMSGEVIELNQDLEKNNCGYDLLQLIVGSEGTLAVISEATLKLAQIPKSKCVLLFSVESAEKMEKLFVRARSGPFEILAFEFFADKCAVAVEKKLNRPCRLKARSAFLVLMELELADHSEAMARVESWLSEVLEENLVLDGMLGQSSEERKALWGLREGITESLALTSQVKKFDVAVPTRKIAQFLDEVQEWFLEKKFEMDLYLFGHLGDGSPHLNLLRKENTSSDTFEKEYQRMEKEFFPLLKRYHGAISAEHGVGILKKHWLSYTRTAEELRLFTALKKAFDPDNLLNPGKLLP